MDNSGIYRLVIFVTALVLLAVWETVTPRRTRRLTRALRWSRNLGIVGAANIFVGVMNALISRFLAPITAAAAAIWADQAGIGLFNIINLPEWLIVIVSIVLLDLLIYAQHVLFHWSPVLWRLHKVHHIDQELDVTSGIRFHPVEIFLSVLIKTTAVVILGAPFIAVVVFEIVLNVSAMFNHGNIRLPIAIDRAVRKVIVTPDMHRVHHSIIPRETHSNFGFNLAIWDRIFGTYIDQPANGHDGMTLGLPEYQDPKRTGFLRMLWLPFDRNENKSRSEDDREASIDRDI